MAVYPESFLNQIKDKVDIVDLISTYVNVQRRGRDYWACCPFHNEKTPSFQIRTDHQYYKCYGCQKAGNIFSFMMEHEKMTFPESIEFLAQKAGLEIPEQVVDKKYKQRKQERDKVFAINKEAAKFYFQNLTQSKGQTGLTYLLNRGISWDTIQTFGMGYSHDFTSLPRYLNKVGYDSSSLVKAGILTYDKKDFFGKRIIIPIISAQGKVVGFTGRSLEKNPDFAKYKNTGATSVFDKRKTLFGINLLKKYTHPSIRSVILVEGHMDVIALYQADIKNVVASMGTALTIEQCRELNRYADLVYVAFDGDSAGQSATMRGLELLKEAGLEVKVVDIKDGLDPDDYVRQFGKSGFTELLDQALPLIDFKLHKIKNKYQLDSYDNRTKYASDAIAVLSELDKLEGAVYVDEVSKNSGINKDILIEQAIKEQGKAVAKPTKPRTPIVKESAQDNAYLIAARFVLSSVLNAKNYVDIKEIDKNLFVMDKHIVLYEYILECISSTKPPKISDVFDILENHEESSKIIDALEDKSIVNPADFYAQCVKKLKTDYINREIKNAVNALKTATDPAKKETLKEKISKLTHEKQKE